MHADLRDGKGRVIRSVPRFSTRFGNDQNPTVELEDIDMVSIELAQNVRSHDFVRRPASRSSLRQVDDPIHDRKKGIDLVCRKEDRHIMVARHPMEEGNNLLHTFRVEVGQWLIKEKEFGLTDERVRNQDPLLLAARKAAHSAIGEVLGVDVAEDLVDPFMLLLGAPPEAETMTIQPEGHKITRPQRHIWIQYHLLRDVAHGSASSGQGRSQHTDLPCAGPLKAEDNPQECGLADSVGTNKSCELSSMNFEGDAVENFPTREGKSDVVDFENGDLRHRCSAEVP
jgi:hypothetical protein